MRVIFVLGNMHHLTGGVPSEEMREMLDHVIDRVHTEYFEYIVFCGGPTLGKSAPGMTEARAMSRYFEKVCDKNGITMPIIVLDDQSLTTHQTILFGGERLLRTIQFENPKLPSLAEVKPELKAEIFCEKSHAFKTRRIFRKVHGFDAVRMHRHKLTHNPLVILMQYAISTPADLLRVRYPAIDQILLGLRKRQIQHA